MDNNRTILAVVLIVLLWSGYSLFFAPQQQVQQPVVEAVLPTEEQTAGTDSVNTQQSSVSNIDLSLVGAEETTYTVETDLFDIEFSSFGASIKSIDLKNYKQTNDVGSPNYLLFDGNKFDLKTLITTGSDGFSIPSNLNFKLVDQDSENIKLSETNNKLSFVSQTDNFTIIKNYIFDPISYSFDLNIQLINTSANPISGKINVSLITPWNKDEKGEMYTFVGPQSYDGNELIEDDADDLGTSPKTYRNDIVWSGYTSKYFINLLNPNNVYEQIFISSGPNYIENKFSTKQINLNVGNQYDYTYSVYYGPKEFELLAIGEHGFENAINYGFFHLLAKPLMVVLKFFYGFLGNYGFSIILLTLCIKIIFWPLTQKSYKSMKGMQKLQPEMKRMREKFGSDKQRLNQEMMSFYKENKVNPLGGCLPMLIQIPVFFALYRVLLGSIELRHAPFMLWITDLSAKDPYYVTPLIMGVTMFIQQKMTPTNMDPTQAKIMLMMPVVFTFMFLNFPAGLVVYWLINNLLTILQQYLIKRQPD